MCGIAGITGFRDNKLMQSLSAAMEHRGPDGEGFFKSDSVSLLSRRLAIIDRAGGDQPIWNEDKTICVVFNGEIYNFKTLRTELEKLGHVFKTASDTEVIVHGYEEWGDSSFDRLNGMFGIAIFDQKEHRVVLARDHFGIKPLYFCPLEGDGVDNLPKLLFASELKPILNSGYYIPAVNEKTLYRYLQFRIHDEGRHTFFAGIHRLLPGERMVIKDNSYKIETYTNLPKDLLAQKNINTSSKDIESRFAMYLEKSIEMRLEAEAKVGSCLSGGLDSSTVVAQIDRLLDAKAKVAQAVGTKLSTFSAVFPGATNNEEHYIDDMIAQSKHVEAFKTTPKPEEFFDELADFVRTQEEPTISTGPYAQFQVAKLAHKKVTVLLDGQGADEILAGYYPYYFVYFRQLLESWNITTLITEAWQSRDSLWVFFLHKLTYKLGLKKTVSMRELLSAEFARNHAQERFSIVQDNLKARLVEDVFANSLQSLLRYEDRNTMRFSLEGRVPFLDINLIRFIFTLPEKYIIRNGLNKWILRASQKGKLPEQIRARKNKIGFTTPEHAWFLYMKNRIYQIFMSESFIGRPYFNQPAVIKAFQAFIDGKTDDTLLFWRILNTELWLREFIDNDQTLSTKIQTKQDNKTKKLQTTSYKPQEVAPNEGKKLEIQVDGKTYYRFPIRTKRVEKGDDIAELVNQSISKFVNQLDVISNPKPVEEEKTPAHASARDSSPLARDDNKEKFEVTSYKLQEYSWFVVLSEKIVAISQGRSYFIWDINPGFWAKTLSKYVTRTPYGIGLGSPFTMQIAISEVGLPLILLATICGAVGKVFKKRGLFYKVAGETVRSIDGPTEYSLYPSNVSAKLGPKDPKEVAEELKSKILNYKIQINSKDEPGVISTERSDEKSPAHTGLTSARDPSPLFRDYNDEKLHDTSYMLHEKNSPIDFTKFLGCAIIDANDLGRNILGNATPLSDSSIESIFADNPMGQASEQTPVTVVFQV